MNKFKQTLLLAPVLALAISVVAVPVAYAHTDENDAEHTHKTRSQSGRVASVSAEKREALEEKLREKSTAVLNEARKGKQARTQEERKKSCEDRKRGLQVKLNRIVSNAKKHQTHITTKYDKAVAYQETAQLSVDNYDALVTAAEAAQEKSLTSVAALEELKPTIDCTSGAVATDVAAFKAATSEARTNLKAYRTAVKEVFVALMNAKSTGTEGESEGTGTGTGAETETETGTETTEGQQ